MRRAGRAFTNENQFPAGLLVPVLLSLLLAATALLVTRRIAPVRAGGGRRRQKPAKAPPGNLPATTHAQPAPERSPPIGIDRTEIKLWRGYVKCELYAANGPADAWAASQPFRFRSAETPNTAALRALSDLLADLEHSGWETVTSGPAWYEQRLERRAPGPDADRAV